MAWRITIEQLRAERDDLFNRIGGAQDALSFEQLARGHRWLDRHDKAERWFRKAADDLLEIEARGGRHSGRYWARIGGLLTLAGALAEAEPWLRRALDSDDLGARGGIDSNTLGPEDRAGVHYLLREFLEAGLAGPGRVPAVLADAVRTGDPAALAAGRAVLLATLRGLGRAGPIDVAVGCPWTEWDWIEESFLVEARLRGEDPPSHEQMLERLGLTGDPSPPPQIELVCGAHAEVVRKDESGDDVRTTISFDGEIVTAVLHPRPERYVEVIFFDAGVGWAAKWIEDPEDDEGMYIADAATFAEVVERAAEWLAVTAPDPPGGAWATAALADLIAELRRG